VHNRDKSAQGRQMLAPFGMPAFKDLSRNARKQPECPRTRTSPGD